MLTARQIADALEVSPRTVYRDIGDLVGSGIPIDGEAGVGYLLRDGYRLPPLMFTREELVALGLGAQMVRVWSDCALGEVTASAIRKIESVLPPSLKDEIRESPLQVPWFMASEQLRDNLEVLRRCVDEKRKVVARYVSLQQAETTRTLRPLLLYFWAASGRWVPGANCGKTSVRSGSTCLAIFARTRNASIPPLAVMRRCTWRSRPGASAATDGPGPADPTTQSNSGITPGTTPWQRPLPAAC